MVSMRLSGQTIYIAIVGLVCAAAIGYVLMSGGTASTLEAQQMRSGLRLNQIPFDGTSAYKYLGQLCAIGPRVAGTPGMTRQIELLAKHFEELGGKVERQEFVGRNPRDGSAASLVNLIVHWHPERMSRLLLCAHYDTRPYPDRDPRNPRGQFVGANDGASGVAVLMELGRHMPKLAGQLGVDFVLFDAEELVYTDPPDPYFLGSTHFARQYATTPPAYKYTAGVLLDMVGDADLQIYVEQQSNQFAPDVVKQVWSTARRLGVREFSPYPNYEVNDDHMPLNRIAKIPTIDVIDFDYPYWHTTQDNAARCSALSLAKVGWVMHEWLKTAVK
ncbi:MAG: M28 family peptidase [Planctomycetes bacterium]|nr:M28 family peptidase [Planctomycetota bacterium]